MNWTFKGLIPSFGLSEELRKLSSKESSDNGVLSFSFGKKVLQEQHQPNAINEERRAKIKKLIAENTDNACVEIINLVGGTYSFAPKPSMTATMTGEQKEQHLVEAYDIIQAQGKINALRTAGKSEYEIMAITNPKELARLAEFEPIKFDELARDHRAVK